MRAVRESAGYPYFIQEYGLELWNHAETSPITTADVKAVREIVTDSLALSFFGILENTHLSRFLTGALLGGVTAFYVVPGLVDMSRIIFKRSS